MLGFFFADCSFKYNSHAYDTLIVSHMFKNVRLFRLLRTYNNDQEHYAPLDSRVKTGHITKISIAMSTGPYTFLSTGLPIIMSQVFYTKPHRTKWRYHQIIIALWSDYYLIFLTLPYLTNPKISTKIGQGYVNCSHKN